MADLEQQLTGLAGIVEWPATPDLRAGVRQQVTPRPAGNLVRTGGSSHGTGSWYQQPWALAAAAVIIAAAALLAYTPSREAIASWVNLHVLVKVAPANLPRVSPLPSGPLGTRLGLGGQTTLAAAQSRISWRILIPASLGHPGEVYLQQPPDGPSQGEVTLVFAARPDIQVSGQTGVSVLITEARGAVNKDFFGKMIGDGTTLEELTVAGHQAYWISGQPHIFFFIDAAGSFRNETMRLATNTLILDAGGTIVRIEGNLTRNQALQIAGSLS